MSTLSIQSVEKFYKAQPILRGIDIHIESGEFLILVGPSGCGKSTLLSIIAGLELPTKGHIYVDGLDITHLPCKDRDIAMVFQSYALYPNMTVAQNIAFGLEMRKIPKEQRIQRISEVAKMLQIEPLLQRKPAQLSGGQRQRVAMGRALARSPKIFLFDEPLSNLDAKLRVEMRAEIKALHQNTRTTTVYVTHDQVEAMTLGDKIAVLKDGMVQQLGSPEDIYNTPATQFVAEFIGSPAMNFLPLRRISDGYGLENGYPINLNDLQQKMVAQARDSQLTYGLRPEDAYLSDAGLAGVISLVEPTGPESYLAVQTEVGKLVVRLPGVCKARVGDSVKLNWQCDKVHIFDGSGHRVC
ncbi:MAG: ABC transporter ATP-binding protein [Gammaproteobacteria bacterium]|nr:ABC transporter ATP-binding protein [Gammaproteobacteria bacterium]